jgi:hypothetical protein
MSPPTDRTSSYTVHSSHPPRLHTHVIGCSFDLELGDWRLEPEGSVGSGAGASGSASTEWANIHECKPATCPRYLTMYIPRTSESHRDLERQSSHILDHLTTRRRKGARLSPLKYISFDVRATQLVILGACNWRAGDGGDLLATI